MYLARWDLALFNIGDLLFEGGSVDVGGAAQQQVGARLREQVVVLLQQQLLSLLLEVNLVLRLDFSEDLLQVLVLNILLQFQLIFSGF